jgi:hypothetical protein
MVRVVVNDLVKWLTDHLLVLLASELMRPNVGRLLRLEMLLNFVACAIINPFLQFGTIEGLLLAYLVFVLEGMC